MYTKILVLVSLTFVLNGLKAQKHTPCLVTTQTGTVIKGTIKKYKPGFDLTKGFTLYNDKNQKMKIKPGYTKRVEVGGNTYLAHNNQKGKLVFMNQVVSGPKANLYRYSIKVTSGIPGEGLSTWYVNEHYLEHDGELRFVDEDDLLQNPEAYFSGNDKLIALIKTRKKNNIDLVKWVKTYNEKK